MTGPPAHRRVPPVAIGLGAAGALPFLAAAIAGWVAPRFAALLIADAGALYGAVILSFIGGAHWGLASRMTVPPALLLRLSVVPALVGWAAVLQPSTAVALAVLAVAFVLVLLIDRYAIGIGAAPVWWQPLRAPLSLTVAALLAVSAAAVWVRTP